MAVPHPAQIRDRNYLNWVKAGLALKYTKEGIESFIDDETKEFHSSLLRKLGQQPQGCGLCTIDNLRPHKSSACPGQSHMCICSKSANKRRDCPNNTCGTLFTAIMSAHRFKGPAVKNSHMSQWVTDYWEVGKNYLPNTGGYLNITSAKETDLSGLVNIGINLVNITNRHTFTRVDQNGSPEDFRQCRIARNKILHSASQSLTEDELSDYLSAMRATLQCTAALRGDPSAQKTLIKLLQLETSELEITDENVTEVRQMARLAIKTEGNKQVEAVRDEGENQRQNMKNEGAVQVDAIKEEGEKQKQYVTSSCVQAEKRALDDIALEGNRQRSIIKTEGDKAIGDADEAIHGMVEVYRRDAAKEVQKEGNQQVKAVKLEGDKQIQNIQQAVTTSADATYQEEQKQLKHNLIENYLAQLQPDTLPEIERIFVEPCMKLVKYGTDGTDNTGTGGEYTVSVSDVKDKFSDDTDSDGESSGTEDERLYSETFKKLLKDDIGCANIDDVFFKNKTKFKRIFISGDAGHGKTSLCKMLVLAWCQVHSGRQINDYIPGDFLIVMKNFEFVFYIALRNIKQEYIVSEMINKQYFVDQDFYCRFITRECDKNSCLVILDGLDEWSAPEEYDLPDFRHFGRFTVLTTTRPWKLEILRLEPPAIDRQVRLIGIDSNASEKYIKDMISLLNKKEKVIKKSADFIQDLCNKDLTHFYNIPIIMKQLITLWHHDASELNGTSQVHLYSAMINHLLRREKNKKKVLAGGTSYVSELPNCLKEKQYCEIHKDLIVSLAHLAFTATIKGHLIFNHVEAKLQNLTEDDIRICLSAGLLCQEIYASPQDDEKKVLSFLHKSFQDFLAAVFLVMNPGVSQLPQTLNSIEKIPEMHSLFMFVVGMGSRAMKIISQHLAKIENFTLTEMDSPFVWHDILELIQKMRIGCVEESKNSRRQITNLENVAVCIVNSQLLSNWQDMKFLLSIYKSCIKYVYIDSVHEELHDDLLNCVTLLSEYKAVQHTYLLLYKRLSRDIESLLEKALCDNWSLSSLKLKGNGCEPYLRYLYRDKMTILVTLEISNISISSPSGYLRIVEAVGKATQLKTLKLASVECSKNKMTQLDLSHCSKLQKIIMRSCFNFIKVTINTASLKFCMVEYAPVYYVSEPHAETTIETLKLKLIINRRSLDELATFLSHQTKLSHLSLEDIDFGDREVCLSSEARYLKEVKLENVLMEKTALIRFFTSIPAYCHIVSFKVSDGYFKRNISDGQQLFVNKIVEILPHLTRITHLDLKKIDFGDREVCLSQATHLKRVELRNVTMTDRAMIQFLDSILTIDHKVFCRVDCRSSKAVKEYISARFDVTKCFLDILDFHRNDTQEM